MVATSTSAMATPPHQSPIAIRSRSAVDDPELPELVIDYPDHVDVRVHYIRHDANDPAGCTIRGPEETIEADVPAGAAAVLLGGVRYELLQFHFHTRSEHVLDDHHYSLEQHYVHRGPRARRSSSRCSSPTAGAAARPRTRYCTRFPRSAAKSGRSPST